MSRLFPVMLAAALLYLPGIGPSRAQTVNTSDIFDGAVTSEKILDGTIKRRDLGDGIVNGAKIEDGSVLSEDILDGTIKRRDLGDGIVNAAKIEDGAIAAAKLGIANTWFIEDSGDDTTNCTRLRNRLTAVVGPALIVLGPGIFDCGTNTVEMVPFVDIQGSGRNVTKIIGEAAADCCLNPDPGVVQGASNSELRALTVEHQGPTTGTGTVAIDSNGATDFRVTDVNATALSDASITSCSFGVVSDGGSTTLTNVIASADGPVCSIGVYALNGTSLSMTGVVAQSVGVGASDNDGLYNFGGTATARHTQFEGDDSGIDNPASTVNLVDSQVTGGFQGGGTYNCFNVYDDTFSALACP